MQRVISRGVGLLLFGAFIGCGSHPGPETADQVQARLESDTGVPWVVTHTSQFVTHVHPRTKPAPVLVGGKTADAVARDFFKAYPALFGIKDVDAELTFDKVA